MIATITPNPALDRYYYIDDFGQYNFYNLKKQSDFVTSPGGKGIKINYMLQKFDIPSMAMGFLGDYTGRKIEKHLQDSAISTNFTRVEQETRTNIFIVDKKNSKMYKIGESGSPLTEEDIELFTENFKRSLYDLKTIIAAGTLPPGLSPDFYKDIVRIAALKGVNTIVYTNPEYLVSILDQNPFMIFPDLNQTNDFLGTKLDTIEACLKKGKEIIQENPRTQLIFFNHLEDRNIAITQDKYYLFEMPRCSVVNKLQISDAIITGIVFARELGLPIKQTIRMGIASSYTIIDEEFCCRDEANIEQAWMKHQIEEYSL